MANPMMSRGCFPAYSAAMAGAFWAVIDISDANYRRRLLHATGF
jgi:hypothetical protein